MIQFTFVESNMDMENRLYRSCFVKSIDENGICVQKTIGVDQLVNLLEKSINEEPKYFMLGDVPRGYIDAKIAEINPLSSIILLYIEEGKRTIIYENSKFTIPMPNMIMKIYIKKERMFQSEIFCLSKDMTKRKIQNLIGEKQQFICYQYPFGNVNDDGSICWGSNVIKPLKKMKDVESLPIVFLDTPSNDDFYGPERTTLNCKDVRLLYKTLETKDSFPYEILIKNKNFDWK